MAADSWAVSLRVILVALVTVALTGLGTGCGGPRLPAGEHGPWEGEASWYGGDYQGRRAADGQRYNMYELTAAHRTLPLGIEVKVTNLENGRSVDVVITDRGPFVEGRIIDLSFAAAQALGMLDAGVARVRIEVKR